MRASQPAPARQHAPVVRSVKPAQRALQCSAAAVRRSRSSSGSNASCSLLDSTSTRASAVDSTSIGASPRTSSGSSSDSNSAAQPPQPSRLAATSGVWLGAVAAAAAAALYLLGAPIQPAAAESSVDFELPYAAPTVTADSSSAAVALARRLRAAGARMYGAFWCSHCYEQKQAFGRQAMADFPYVECYPDGWRRGVRLAEACEAANVQAFPTWVINGQVVEGELELQQLADALDAPPPDAQAPAPALQAAVE